MNRMRILLVFLGKKIGHFDCIRCIRSRDLLYSSLFILYYRTQRSCGKIMFLHLSVIQFRGAESLSRGDLCLGLSVRGRGVCPGGVSVQRDLCPGGLCPEGLCGVSLQGDISVQRGISVQDGHLCPGGISVQGVSVQEGGRSLSAGGGLCQGDPPPYGYMRAVCIPLECILVSMHNRVIVNTAFALTE